MADRRINAERSLNFTGRYVEATLVENVKDYQVAGRTVVVNPGVSAVALGETPRKFIPAFSSTILSDVVVEQADLLVLLRTDDSADISGIVEEPGWNLLGELLGEAVFPTGTPLWKSPQDDAGDIALVPSAVLGEPGTGAGSGTERMFGIRLNLWFAPSGTDCAIHNQHGFIEVHSQVHGLGRMQKFREQDHGTLYQDVLMSPGYTTPDPFCGIGPHGTFVYPWHQYHADSDCVWLAVEYHAHNS
jgi:hypothetical protein